MHTLPVRILVGSVLAALLVVVPAARAVAQESKSSSAARELVQLMQAQKLDSLAARQPAAPDQFVAALFFPGQLLVVWAKYSAPALLNEKIVQRNFRDVYIDLNSAAVANSKFLITDLGADGLKARREDNQPFDAQDANGKTFQFDGNWREDKMSEEEYMKAFASADEGYAQALAVLLGVMKKG
jgi:type II secretory pathway pseudopilin PulG